jgi:hypothetical protein
MNEVYSVRLNTDRNTALGMIIDAEQTGCDGYLGLCGEGDGWVEIDHSPRGLDMLVSLADEAKQNGLTVTWTLGDPTQL